MTNQTAALTILYNEVGFALDEPMNPERAANLRAAMRIVAMTLPAELIEKPITLGVDALSSVEA